MKAAQTFKIQIFIAGDLNTLRKTCQKFCERGCCVTITPTEYIYTGGAESGAVIGLINYPRFPKSNGCLSEMAFNLARQLMGDAGQRSCTVMGPTMTFYLKNPNIRIPR